MFGFNWMNLVSVWYDHPIIWTFLGVCAWTGIGAVILVPFFEFCDYIDDRIESNVLYNLKQWMLNSWYILGFFLPLRGLYIITKRIVRIIQRFHYRSTMERLTGEKPWIRGQDPSMMRKKIEGIRKAHLINMKKSLDKDERKKLLKEVKLIEKLAPLYGLTLMSRERIEREDHYSDKLIMPGWM